MPKKTKLPLGGVCLTLLFSLLCLVSNAQKTVTGKVNGAAPKPISGASITVKGTSLGTFTDNNGAFSLTVPVGKSTLVVSSVGFEAKELDYKHFIRGYFINNRNHTFK